MKRLKQLFIGLALSLLLVPLLKNNVYADVLLDHTFCCRYLTSSSTSNAIKVKNVNTIRWRYYVNGSNERAGFKTYAVNGSQKVLLFSGSEGSDSGTKFDIPYTITPAQKSAYGEWYLYSEVNSGIPACSDSSNYSIVDVYGTPTLSCNHYEAKEYYQYTTTPSGGTLLDYNEAHAQIDCNTTLNATALTSVDYVKWTFHVDGSSESSKIRIFAEKPGSSICLYEVFWGEDDPWTYDWYFPITEGMKIAYPDYYLNVYLDAGSSGDVSNISRGEVYGSPAPTFTSGATLTATNLSYSGTTSKQYSVSANNASSYTWYLDGSPNPTGASNGTYTANIANLSHGNHTLKCVANGAGGTTSSTNQITFNVNRTPVISSGNLTAVNLSYASTPSKAYSCSATGAVSYNWLLDGVSKQNTTSGSYTVNLSSLSGGTHKLKCEVKGVTGAPSATTNEITFTCDYTPKLSTQITTTDANLTQSSNTVSSTYGVTGGTVTYTWEKYVNGAWVLANKAGGTASFKMGDFVNNTNGTYYIRCHATNTQGGSIYSSQRKVTTNWTPVNVKMTAPTAAQNLTLSTANSFNATAASTVAEGTVGYEWYIGSTKVGTGNSHTFYMADFGNETNANTNISVKALVGSNGAQSSTIGVTTNWTPIFTTSLPADRRKITTVEGSTSPMTVAAKFPNASKGWYHWQYRLGDSTTWVDINNASGIIESKAIFKDGGKEYDTVTDGLFGISSIPATDAVSILTVKAATKDMANTRYRCILEPNISGIATRVSDEFTLEVLPSQFKNFTITLKDDSIGAKVYDNSIVMLAFEGVNGQVGERRIVHGDLKSQFKNPVNNAPYYNVINLDAPELAVDNKKEKLWGIADNRIYKNDSDGCIYVTCVSPTGTNSYKITELPASAIANYSNITDAERDKLYRAVIGDIATLRAITEKDNDAVTILGGRNLYIGYLSPFRTCECASFTDSNSDGKCDTCGAVNYDSLNNYVFASTPVNGLDNESPIISDITARWIGSAGVKNFHEDGAIFKQGVKGTNNTPLSGSAARPLQDLKLSANIADNSVALEDLTIKWYHQPIGSSQWNEITNPALIALTENGSELTVIGTDSSNGMYKVTACDGINDLDTPPEKEFEVGVVFDTIEPTVTASVTPPNNEPSRYKEIIVEAQDNVGGTGLASKPYFISTKMYSNEALADEEIWSSKNSLVVDSACDVYIYVRDNAGMIAKLESDEDGNPLLRVENIDYTAPCFNGIDIEKIDDGEDAIVMVTINATDDQQEDPDLLGYKMSWICERAGNGHNIGDEVPVRSEFTNDKTFEATESGYYKIYISDDAGNVTEAMSSYIDLKFIKGELGDIFSGEKGGGFVDEKGGFKDEHGGFKDEHGGFVDTDGGFVDGFVDEKGGFIDNEGGFVNNNGFVDNNGFKDSGYKDTNGFIDETGFVNKNGYVDNTSYHDYKGDTTTGDNFCDNCGKSQENCTCGDGNYVDNESPDGFCDGCNVAEADKANCTCGGDGKCDVCGFDRDHCTCPVDTLCDNCGKTRDNCTCTTPDGLCDNCFETEANCTCGPDEKCDSCHQSKDDCTCSPDGRCDGCGLDRENCTCPKDQLCDYCGLDREHCTCPVDDKCDKCGKIEAECTCGDGICDRCGETEENCHCKDGLCDNCGQTRENCGCRDGVCDKCGETEENCLCGDGFCDKCGLDEDHCNCPDGICDVCGRDEEHCICPDGLCDVCGQDEDHCHCPDGLCDKCGQDREHCQCVGVSVKWKRTPMYATNGDVTFTVTVTANALNILDSKPFSWDGGETWTDDFNYVVDKNGDYILSVKDKFGHIYTATKPEEVRNIDKNKPRIAAVLDSETNDITVQVSEQEGDSGLYKITYFYIPEGSSTRSEERAWRPVGQGTFSAESKFHVEETGDYIFRVYDMTEAYNTGKGNWSEDKVSTDPSKLSTTNPDVSLDKEKMKSYISASPEGWTTSDVTLTLTMSNEGLDNNPYCWDGLNWVNRPYYRVSENATISLKVKDKQGHIYEAAPFVVDNIDRTAPEFTLTYRPTNGNYLEVEASDLQSGLASIYWQGGTVTSVTKALDIIAAPKSGTYTIEIPSSGTYRVYVVDVNGNGFTTAESKTFKATSVGTADTNPTNGTSSNNSSDGSNNNGLTDAQYKGLISAISALGNKGTGSGSGTTNNYYSGNNGSSGSSGNSGYTTQSRTTTPTSTYSSTPSTYSSTPSTVSSTPSTSAGKIQSTSSSSSTTKTSGDSDATKAKTATSSSSSKVKATTAKPNPVVNSSTTKAKVATLTSTKPKDDEAGIKDADIEAMNRNSRIQGVEATADNGAKKGINIILAIFAGLVAIGGITAGIWYYNKKHNEYVFDDIADDMEFDESMISEDSEDINEE